jgi:hypothetical protein
LIGTMSVRTGLIIPIVAMATLACPGSRKAELEIYSNSLDTLDDVLNRTGAALDTGTSHDGQASIRFEVTEPRTIQLAEIEPEAVENARLIYRACLKTQDLSGQAYLEMWCVVEGMGEFFSRALHAPVSGTTDWVTQETPFFLEKGQRAKMVKLNLVVTGAGTVWVDDMGLVKVDR